MADLLRQIILLHRIGQKRCQIQSSLRLADARNIIVLALDRQQRSIDDCVRIDRLAPMDELALGQRVPLEHVFDGLEVEFLGHVAHAQVFVVKHLDLVGAVLVAHGQVFEHLVVALHMALQVHRHEPGQLHEPGVNFPPCAGIAVRHGRDHVAAEPAQGLVHCQIVHAGRAGAGIHRAAHHRQAGGAAGVFFRAHHGGGGEGWHRRLAHRQHMRGRADELQKFNQVIDVVVQIEPASG